MCKFYLNEDMISALRPLKNRLNSKFKNFHIKIIKLQTFEFECLSKEQRSSDFQAPSFYFEYCSQSLSHLNKHTKLFIVIMKYLTASTESNRHISHTQL